MHLQVKFNAENRRDLIMGARGFGDRSTGIWLSELLRFGYRIGQFYARIAAGLVYCEKMKNENMRQFSIISALISASTLC